MTSKKFDLINKTRFSYDAIKELVEFPKLQGLGSFIIIVKDCQKTIKAGGQWEGDANNIAKLSIPVMIIQTSPKLKYPFKIEGVKKEGYLNYVVSDRKELILYLITHELRNLWQARKKYPLSPTAHENDADTYAIKTVEEWRKGAGP